MSSKDDIVSQTLKIECYDICPNCNKRLDQTEIHFVYRNPELLGDYKCLEVVNIYTGEK